MGRGNEETEFPTYHGQEIFLFSVTRTLVVVHPGSYLVGTVVFESITPLFEWVKTFHALDREATVIGFYCVCVCVYTHMYTHTRACAQSVFT
jgi:hypothetical protein